MYFWFVRLFHVPISIFFGLVDLIIHPIYEFLGFQNDDFLQKWQETLGPKPPITYPPKLLAGEPHYPFSKLDTAGHFRASVVVDYIDRDAAQAMLPDYLELAPDEATPPGKHPATLIFGWEENIRPVFAFWKGPSYAEFVIALPDVRLKGVKDGYSWPFFFMPQLRLIRFYPILLGLLVGYNKIPTRLPATEDTFMMKTAILGRLMASYTVKLRGKTETPDALNSPAMEVWLRRLNQPMVARLFFTGILFTHYQWEWNKAKVRLADSKLSVAMDGIPGYPPGVYEWPAFDSARGTGAMAVFLPFEWLAPFGRRVLDEHQARLEAVKVKAAGAG